MKTKIEFKNQLWLPSKRLAVICAGLLLAVLLPDRAHAAPGDVDESFNPGSSFSHPITAIQLQPDGKALVVGRFTAAPGAYRGRVARLNLDGSTDESFLGGLPGADGDVLCATLQPDGKLVIGGSFAAVNGVTRNRIARLNGDGTVDESFQNGLAGVTGEVESMARQSNGQILVGGTFSGNGLTNLARLNADGSLDTSFIGKTGGGYPGDGAVIAIAVQSDGKIVIAGWFTSVNDANRSYLARLTASGVLDNTFTPTFTTPGNIIELGSLFLQSDDKLIIGGWFNGVNGVARNNLARLNANGTTDASFLAGLSGPDNRVYAIAQLSGGKILIGGWFTTVNGVARAHLARLNSNGSLDTLFASATTLDNVLALAVQADGRVLASSSLNYEDPTYLCRFNADGSADTTYCTVPRGPDSAVAAVARQSDGKVVIGGWFQRVNGLGPSYLARLNPDGSRDGGFLNGMAGFNNPVEGILCQPNGQVLVRGRFTSVNGTARDDLARLQADGAVDASFTPTLQTIYTPALSSFVLQPDGRILLAGNFTSVNGVSRNRVARLNPDGTLDNSFLNGVSGFNNQVRCLALQPDGKILAGGYFTSVNGAPRTNLARLRVDGTLDETFQASVGELTCLALQLDGKILAAGYFSSVGGLSRTNLARLNADGSADPSFGNVPPGIDPFYFTSTAVVVQPDGRILYGRMIRAGGGVVPMLTRVNADGSTDSSFDVRFTGGYGEGVEIMAIVLEADGHILAAGTFATVNQFARRQVVRLLGDSPPLASPPTIFTGPQSQTAPAGGTASFSVHAGGSAPLGYQWLKDGANLSDGGNISGAQTPMLTQTNLFSGDAGGYAVVITNAYGSVTSLLATLTVADPFIVTQPASLSRNGGQTAQFTVAAAGTPPLAYQWRKDGLSLSDGGKVSGAQTATLTLSSVSGSDRGGYTVLVGNSHGSVTSLVATLAVADPFIIAQPASQTASAGQTVQFSVVAGGTAPFSYQWLKNGLALSDGGNIFGARTATLTLSSVSGGTAGSYAVVVSNGYSSVTSSVAVLALLTQSELVVNGSFESPVVSSCFEIFTSIPGWTTTFGPGIEIQHNCVGTAFEGQQLVELDSASNSGMAQQIPTMPGQAYQLGLAYSPRPGDPRESNVIDVFFNNTLLASIAEDGTQLSDTRWSIYTWSVVAGGSNSRLEFRATGTRESFGGYLDAVHLTPIGPATLTVLPASQTAELGATVWFSTDVTNSPPLAYQWFFNGTNAINRNTTNTFLELTNVQSAHSGAYSVVAVTSSPAMLSVIPLVERRMVAGLRVSGEVGTSLNIEYTDAIAPAPTWLPLATMTLASPVEFCFDLCAPLPPQRFYRARQAGSPTVLPALDLHLIPAITLTGSVGSKVRLDGINIIGPTNAWFPVDTVTLTNTSQLCFDVSGIGQPQRLYRIVRGPTLLQSPETQTAELGASAHFAVEASGLELTYQLIFNGTNLLSFGTESCLELTNVTFSQAGAYAVVVTNALGSVTSAPAMLNVIPVVERRSVPGIKLFGEAGSTLNLEYTEALGPAPAWWPLATVSLGSPPQFEFDLTAPLPPQRFYRAWQTGTPAVLPSLNLNFVPAITLTGDLGSKVRVDGINQFGPIDAWFALDTVTLTNTSQLYFDVSVIGQPQRLYRLVPVP